MPLQWWLHGPLFRDADAFLFDELVAFSFAVSVIEGTVIEVLAALAADFATHNLRYAALPGRQIPPAVVDRNYYGVLAHFAEFERHGAYQVVREQQVLRGAYLAAVEYNLALRDAMAMTSAEAGLVPLLVADDSSYEAFRAVAARRQDFRVVWLPDYRRELR